MKYIKRLYGHMEWADEQVLKKLRSISTPEALGLFAHVLAAEAIWLERLAGRASGAMEVFPERTINECADHAARNAEAYKRMLDGLTAEELDEEITYANSKGNTYTNTRADILLHVATHGVYHRGQIATRLKLGTGETVSTDMMPWLRM